MDSSTLSLRQRKLIYYIQNQSTYITGEDLANHLHVSARTVRNDINEVNDILSDWKIQIISKRSCGYLLKTENEENLKKLNQLSNSFLSREDRIRYISFRLCLSDKPVNLYDLEDEMFISHTTLEQDLLCLRKIYTLPSPHIIFHRSKNNISFGSDERKRRALLNRLFTENWNYNARGNAYYQYQYLEEDVVNLIMSEVNYFMRQYNILMEDINMVILNLTIAIMYFRISSNHELMDSRELSFQDSTAIHATEDLLNALEEKLSCQFSIAERAEIYLHVSCSRLLDSDKLHFATIDMYFDASIIAFADTYIAKIMDTFHIDFSDNEDFYVTLLQYLRYLSLPIHHLNDIQTHSDMARSNMLIEFELAFLIQPLALDYYGNYLDQTELLYLSFCISGALAYTNRTAPKLKTVIMGHLNLPSSWSLKQKLLNSFQEYIDLIALLPVYVKDNYNFSKIDLIITTANKEITDDPHCKTMVISPFFTPLDQANLEFYILKNQINRLYNSSLPSLTDLFSTGFWHEQIQANNYISIIELLAADFMDNVYISAEYLSDILRREAILTFSFRPSIVLLYSLVPSTRTCLSIATLEHRIKWNSYKIRTVIMAAIHPRDASLIFRMINELYYEELNLNDSRFLKTKKELMDFFESKK